MHFAGYEGTPERLSPLCWGLPAEGDQGQAVAAAECWTDLLPKARQSPVDLQHCHTSTREKQARYDRRRWGGGGVQQRMMLVRQGRSPNDTSSGMSTKVLLSIAAISSIIASVIARSFLKHCPIESALRHVCESFQHSRHQLIICLCRKTASASN